MKKYILSLGVIVIFAGYVIYSRKGGNDNITITPPAGLTTATTATTSANSTTSSAAGNGTPPTPQQTTPAPTPSAASAKTPPQPAAAPPVSQGQYKNGSYTSPVADAYFGNLQIQAVISGGKLTDIIFLQYPNDNGHSQQVSQQALPYLKAEAIQAQSANVNIVSGATQSSQAFQQALATVLSQAKS